MVEAAPTSSMMIKAKVMVWTQKWMLKSSLTTLVMVIASCSSKVRVRCSLHRKVACSRSERMMRKWIIHLSKPEGLMAIRSLRVLTTLTEKKRRIA
jgi:hypothetical protein